MTMKKKKYSHKQIVHLGTIDGIRARPAMYIDDTDHHGYHQILKELIDNAVDEYVDGHVSSLEVLVDTKEQMVEVRDNGRGIPIEFKKKLGISTLTAIFTLSHTGGKLGTGAYTSATSGLHGIGAKATNALSQWLQVWTKWKGATWTQRFEQGVAKTEVVKDPKRKLKSGTVIQFRPDPTIFKNPKVKFDSKWILSHLEDTSYLCPGLEIIATIDGKASTFKSTKGLEDMLSKEVADLELLHKPLLIRNELFDLCLVWTKETDGEKWKSFVNTSPTANHGTHVEGVKKALQRMFAISDSAKKEKLRGDDLRDGLVAIINAKVPNPEFKGQTKSRLGNAEVLDLVYSACIGPFKQWAGHNGNTIKALVSKAVSLRDARQQYRAKQQAIKGVKIKQGARGLLPGKLCEAPDCGSEIRELFIVEGDSAGGTVKKGRLMIPGPRKGNPVHFQEVLPLRGKTLNVARKSDLDKILGNAEIKAIVQAIGAGIGDSFDVRKCRYKGIYILTDADPDGKHICALLLAFFSRYFPELISEERLFVVLSPLFRGVSAKREAYGPTVEAVKKKLGKSSNIRITRFKGLGESDASELRTYALDPATRKTMKVQWKGKKDQNLTMRYMGNDVKIRKRLLDLRE